MAVVTQLNLLKNRRTKIVATVGPASSSPHMLEQLLLAGVNVFRLNMSHGNHESHRQVFQDILSAADQLQRSVGILIDLCGPKIRTGQFKMVQSNIHTGDVVTITTRPGLGTSGIIV